MKKYFLGSISLKQNLEKRKENTNSNGANGEKENKTNTLIEISEIPGICNKNTMVYFFL